MWFLESMDEDMTLKAHPNCLMIWPFENISTKIKQSMYEIECTVCLGGSEEIGTYGKESCTEPHMSCSAELK